MSVASLQHKVALKRAVGVYFTFASNQRYSEDVLKSSLCQLCKIYVIFASKLLQLAGFHLVMFLEL